MINKRWFFKPNIAISNIRLYFLAFSILQIHLKDIIIRFL